MLSGKGDVELRNSGAVVVTSALTVLGVEFITANN